MSKTSKTTSSSSTPAHQQKQGQYNPLILAMAACLALSSLPKPQEPSTPPKSLFYLARIRISLLGYFSTKGVVFDAEGNPSLPAMVLDAHTRGPWSNMPASIFQEAQTALLMAVQAAGFGKDEQNPTTQAVDWLFTQALKAGADHNFVINDPDLGGPRPVVVLSFYCDPTTGSPLWGPLQSLPDEG